MKIGIGELYKFPFFLINILGSSTFKPTESLEDAVRLNFFVKTFFVIS